MSIHRVFPPLAIALSTLLATSAAAVEDFHDDNQLLVKSIQQLQMGATPERMDANFRYADTNKDGLLNRFEAGRIKGLSTEFNLLDLDNSRDLDRQEFERLLDLTHSNAMTTMGWRHGRKAGR